MPLDSLPLSLSIKTERTRYMDELVKHLAQLSTNPYLITIWSMRTKLTCIVVIKASIGTFATEGNLRNATRIGFYLVLLLVIL